MEYGYVRVSTKEQNEQRQMIALQEFGIDVKRIYMDKQITESIKHDYMKSSCPFTHTADPNTKRSKIKENRKENKK